MNTTMSENTSDLFTALSKAQAEIEGAAKDSTNPHFRSKYADLASVWAACKSALTKHGLSVVQVGDSDDPDVAGMTTILGHSSGQWIRGRMTMRPVKADPQGLGSCTTYLRRYCLAAMVGVAPEDDDGNAASSRQETSLPSSGPDRLGEVVKALEAEDGWQLLRLTAEDQQGFRFAFGRLNSKQKAACRELEQRAASARVDYVDSIRTMVEADDGMGISQLLEELSNPLAKKLVWAQLGQAEKAYITSMKAPA